MSLQRMFSVVQNIIIIFVFFCNALRNALQEIFDIGNFLAICTTLTKIPKQCIRLLKMFIIKCLNMLPLPGKTVLRVLRKNNEKMYSRNMTGNFAENVLLIINCIGELRTVDLKPRYIFKKYFEGVNMSSIYTPIRQIFMVYVFGVRSSPDDGDGFDDSESNSSTENEEDTVSHFEAPENGLTENKNMNFEKSPKNLAREPNAGPLAKRKSSCELIHTLKRIKNDSEIFDGEENATTDICIQGKYFEEKTSLSLNISEEKVLSTPSHKTNDSVSIIPSLINLLESDSGENGNAERNSNMKEYQLKFDESNPEKKCLQLIPDIEVWKRIANEISKLDQLIEWINHHPEVNEKLVNWFFDSESSSDTEEDEKISCDEEGPLEPDSNTKKAMDTIPKSELALNGLSEKRSGKITIAKNLAPEFYAKSLLKRMLSGEILPELKRMKSESDENDLSPNSESKIHDSISIVPSLRNGVKNDYDVNDNKEENSNTIDLTLPKLDESNPENLERCMRLVPDIEVWKNIAKAATKMDQLIEKIKCSKELKELGEKKASDWSSDSESSSDTDGDQQMSSIKGNSLEGKETCEVLEGSLRVVFNSSPVKITSSKVASQGSEMDGEYRKGCLKKMKKYKILSKEQENKISKDSLKMDENLSGVSTGNRFFDNDEDDVNDEALINNSQITSNELPSEYQDVPPLITYFPQELENNECFVFVNSEKPHVSFDSPASKKIDPRSKKIDDQNLDANRATKKIAPEVNTGLSSSYDANSNSSQKKEIYLPLPLFANPDISQVKPVPVIRHANKQSQGYAQNDSTVLSESAPLDKKSISSPSLELSSTIGIDDFEIGESSKPEGMEKSPESQFRDPDYKPYPGMVLDTTKVKKDARYQKKFYQKPS